MSDEKPLNIWSNSDEEIGRRMSHFAHTPFELDGVIFGSVEAFYSWLLVENNDAKRAKIAPMWGARSKHACPKTKPDTIDYHGRKIRPSSPEHRELIMRANRAKLDAYQLIWGSLSNRSLWVCVIVLVLQGSLPWQEYVGWNPTGVVICPVILAVERALSLAGRRGFESRRDSRPQVSLFSAAEFRRGSIFDREFQRNASPNRR